MTDSQSAADYPLAHLKVLDFSRVLAGPFAGRLLCDLGADVVKVEPPDGDITRLWGRVIGNLPGYYHQQNAGKRNICIDLRTDGGRQLAGSARWREPRGASPTPNMACVARHPIAASTTKRCWPIGWAVQTPKRRHLAQLASCCATRTPQALQTNARWSGRRPRQLAGR